MEDPNAEKTSVQ